jgi:hypothetical protein
VSGWAAGLAAVTFTALAGLHGYWALGGFWPGRDGESLALTVVGSWPGSAPPGRTATWTVAALLLGAAVTVLGAAGVVPLPVAPGLVRGAALLGAGVLLVRGLEGFVDTRLRPSTVGSPFARLNVRIYSPLCLLLALLTYLAAGR